MITTSTIYSRVTKSWGGATIDLATQSEVPSGIDAYAVTIKPRGVHSVEIPETADEELFQHSVRNRYPPIQLLRSLPRSLPR